MKRLWTALLLLAAMAIFPVPLHGSSPTGPAEVATTRPATAAERELSAAIALDARPGYLPKETRQLQMHARRAAALSGLALRLDSSNLLAHTTLAEAREMLFDWSGAADAAGNYLRLVGFADHRWFTKYLSYNQSASKKVEERLAFLQAVIADERLPAAARALALTSQAALEHGKGNFTLSENLRKAALALDGNLVEAVSGAAGLSSSSYPPATKGMAPVLTARLLLTALRSDPSAFSAAWDLGRLCRRMGDYPSSLVYFDHTRQLAAALGAKMPDEFELDYLNTLLDAGLWERAVREFAPQVPATSAAAPGESASLNLNMAALLVEAYRQLGQPEPADALVERMARVYQAQESVAAKDAATAAALAWFHHRFSHRSETAVQWAATALRQNSSDPTIQRIWAITMLGSSQALVARSQLDQLAATDPYAAASLADYEFSQGSREAGQRRLEQAAASVRAQGGWPAGKSEWQVRPAWRYMVDVATRHGAQVPEAPEAAEVAELIRGHDPRYLEIGQHPERYVTIRLKPLAAEVRPGEPLLVEAVLTNVSSLAIPVNGTELMRPSMLINVTARRDGESTDIAARTLVNWAASKYLSAGSSVRYVFSVDVGAIGQALQDNPLASYDLTVSAIFDPVERDKQYAPRFPALKVEPVRLRRVALMSQDDPKVYWDTLVELVKQLRGSDETKAMRAATVTVSLLKMVQDVNAGRGSVGPAIRQKLHEPELLSMLRFCLQEAPMTVKVRTLGAMQSLNLSGVVGQLVRPCLQSPEAAVRARAADLVGMSTSYTDKAVLRELAVTDSDSIVREVAKVHLPMPTTIPAMAP